MSKRLPDLQNEPVIEKLPPLNPQFFIPRLAERPQNPIMDSVKLLQDLKRPPVSLSKLMPNTLVKLPDSDRPIQPQSRDTWNALLDTKASSKISFRSWDTFGSLRSQKILPPYLSEQDSIVFATARHHMRPLLIDSTFEVLYVDQQDLLDSVRLVVTGTSSVFHSWDPKSDRFVLRGMKSNNRGFVVVVGKDEVITESFLSRFLTIGTISRRLEVLINDITNSDTTPTVHAFAHALSSMLTLLRITLAESFNISMAPSLSSFWVRCAEAEQVLTAVAKLCHRDVDIDPTTFTPLPSATELVSDIYLQCVHHFEHSSSRIVTAIFAFILTTTSKDYFQQMRLSVGFRRFYGSPTSPNLEAIVSDEGATLDSLKVKYYEHPCFVPQGLQSSLQNAQKSLRILESACPDHPLLTEDTRDLSSLGWFWTAQEVIDAWDRRATKSRTDGPQPLSSSPPDGLIYKSELAGFQVFDRDPGAHLTDASPFNQIQIFVKTFPPSLPALTPTFDILTSLVLSPLSEHAASLSETLLEIFMSPTTSKSLTHKVDLNLHSHLILLRSFLLLCSHSFKSKLSTALFSDSDQYLQETQLRDARTLALTQRPPPGLEEQKVWPVGLALGLIARESWPPGGSELAFYLRTVIVDSIEVEANRKRSQNDSGMNRLPTALDMAESRLGFAIRDLPTGKGRDRWLDPCSIEALDFLYMEYNPPGPLQPLISPEIMSKYRRVFAFNLRLMRVENVVRVLYRMSRSRKSPLFATFTRTNARFLHFRILIQTFFTQFMSYIYDTAIRGNFDAFLEMLRTDIRPFPDIFALAEYHSNIMDDILTACLLRSGQKAAGDVLRGCLEIILELGVLSGELTRGRIEEYRAKVMLEELYEAFKSKMVQLVQVLKMLTEKEVIDDSASSSMKHGKIGGVHSIQHLLVKIDSGWWRDSHG